MIERQRDVEPGHLGPVVADVDHVTARILDQRLMPGPSGELVVEPELEAREALVVDADIPQHLRAHGMLRVPATLVGDEAEPRDPLLREQRGLAGVRLSREVDEPARPVGELRIQRVRIEREHLRDFLRDASRLPDLHRVRINRRRALAERDADAGAVEDRSAARRDDDLLAVLREAEPGERLGPDPLKPGRAQEEAGETDDQRDEEEPDPSVDETAHAVLSG